MASDEQHPPMEVPSMLDSGYRAVQVVMRLLGGGAALTSDEMKLVVDEASWMTWARGVYAKKEMNSRRELEAADMWSRFLAYIDEVVRPEHPDVTTFVHNSLLRVKELWGEGTSDGRTEATPEALEGVLTTLLWWHGYLTNVRATRVREASLRSDVSLSYLSGI